MKMQMSEGKTAKQTRYVLGALFCFLLLVLTAPLALNAQQYSGTITGTVSDPSGAAVAGAAVTATNTGNNASYSTTTSEQGVYSFAQLPVGMYNIVVKHGQLQGIHGQGSRGSRLDDNRIERKTGNRRRDRNDYRRSQ